MVLNPPSISPQAEQSTGHITSTPQPHARPLLMHTVTAVAALTALLGLGCVLLPAAAQPVLCEGMSVRVTASRKAAELASSVHSTISAKVGHRVKVYVSVTNANTTHAIESVSIGLRLPDGLTYLKALPPKQRKGELAMNGWVLPAPTGAGLTWLELGPIPALASGSGSGSGKAEAAALAANTWTQGLELWPQECALSAEASLDVTGVVTLSGGGGTCDLPSISGTLTIHQPRGEPSKKATATCSAPVPQLNLGLPCTMNAQCSTDGRSACVDGACVAPVTAVGQPCTADNQCGSGNNCLDGVCRYCARIGQGCGPPDICPGENQKCRFGATCGGLWTRYIWCG